MKHYVTRLSKGDDLKKSIIDFCENNKIKAGAIISAVGSLYEIRLRKADGKSEYFETKDFEIVSLSGTIANNGVHFHIALSDSRMKTIGGHLLEGCLVNTTVEFVIISFEDIKMERKYDETTGYKELEVSIDEK